MIKAIIFDLDGLLVDTEIISFKVYQQLLKAFNIRFSKEEYSKYYSGKTELNNIKQLTESYHLDWTIDQGIKEVLDLEQIYLSEGVLLKPGAKELLSFLKNHNYKIALATSSLKERALNILDTHKLLHYFDVLVFSEDIAKSKSNPEIFLKALNKLDISNQETIILEDSENGILAANKAHIPVICIPDMKIPANDYLDNALAVYRSLNDVKEYLIGVQNNTPTLYTERLILRKFNTKDMQAIFEIFQDKIVNEFLPWFPLKTLKKLKSSIKKDIKLYMIKTKVMPMQSV